MNLYQTIIFFCVTVCSMATHHRKQTKSCSNQFSEHLNKCLGTFTPYIELYTGTKPKDPFVHHIFVQHVCRNYKKMLLCIHVVLSNCKTMDNIEEVQQTLSTQWVVQVNFMCNINSNSSRQINSTIKSSATTTDKSFSQTINSEKETQSQQRKDSHHFNGDLSKSALFKKLMHSSNTDLEIITMFVFRSAPKTTKQTGSMPNSSDGADKQKLDSRQKYHSSNLLHLFISLGGTSNKDANLVKYSFLAQNENSSDRNGTKRHFSWHVVVLITITNYLFRVIR